MTPPQSASRPAAAPHAMSRPAPRRPPADRVRPAPVRRVIRVSTLGALALLIGACATATEPDDSPLDPVRPTATESPDPVDPGDDPGTDPGTGAQPGDGPIDLTVVLDETGGGTPRTMTLTCDPPGGDHPEPEAACDTLGSVDTSVFEPPPEDEVCTEQYGGPQVAEVSGTVHGEQVSARFTRTNGCEIARWDRLAPVLGSPGAI